MTNYLFLSLFSLITLAFLVDYAIAQTPVFGPEKYIREPGKPRKIKRTFTTHNTSTNFTLIVQNGKGIRERASSAIIELNGESIVSPSAFNKKVDIITKEISLQQENELIVQVRSAPGSSIIITVMGKKEPPSSPVNGITVTPDGFPINTPTQVDFKADIPYSVEGDVPFVELIRVSRSEDFIGIEGKMVDDGDLSFGDEIQGDGVFSFRKTYTLPQPDDINLRARAYLNGEVYYSDIFTLTSYIPISETEASMIDNVQINAERLYHQLLHSKGNNRALASVVKFLKSQDFVQDAGVSESMNSVWIKYNNGMQGGISFNPPDTRGGSLNDLYSQNKSKKITTVLLTNNQSPTQVELANPSNIFVKSNKVIILSPFLDEFPKDEGLELKELYDRQSCPAYDGLDGKPIYFSNNEADVDAFKTLGEYGIIHIASHGSVNNNRVVIYTKSPNSTHNLQIYQTDIQKGRLTIETINARTWLAITPSFFSYYVKSMPSSLIFFSSCFSTYNNSMANVFQAKGAKAFIGFSSLVPSNFAYNKAVYFHRSWVEDPTTLVTTGEVFNGGCSGGACWNLLGASNLEAPSGKLQNGDFEAGLFGAWKAEGDARILSQLVQFNPFEGSFLGLISTGLGFTTTSGSIEQKICLPTNSQTLDFHWNFNSEEFVEWCNSGFQDTFRLDVITETATRNIFSRKVDDLCDMISPSNLTFDQSKGNCNPTDGVGFGTGGNDCIVWTTDWLSESIDITEIATANHNKAVTLKFSAIDVGDSIFDSAVLLDNIKITTP